jgi:tetratricopeptide (TPR) repeat protein
MIILRPNLGEFGRVFWGFNNKRERAYMSDFWDYRGWERNEEDRDWQDIQGDNLEYRADALLSKAHRNGLEKEEIEKTIVYIASANDINREIGRMPELLHGLLMLGDCYLKLEKADEVRECALEAQQIALETFNDKARAYAIHMQGYNSFVARKHIEAAEFALNAAEIYEESGHYEEACDMYLSAGRIFRWRGQRASATSAFERALEVARTDENIEFIVYAKSWIAFMQTRVERVVDFETVSNFLSQTQSQMMMAKFNLSATRRYELAFAWNNVEANPTDALKYFDHWLEQAKANKVINDSIEAMLGRAYCFAYMRSDEAFKNAVMSVLATLEEIEATVNPIEAITPLSGYYFANEMFEEAEQLWARGKQIAERWQADAETLAYYDRMIALAISEYAEPARALSALESQLPKTLEDQTSLEFEFALAKSYAKNNRDTESLIVIDRALESHSDEIKGEVQYAELHELKCELLAKAGNLAAARNEAKLSFDAYIDLDEFDRAKRLKQAYLQPQVGDANPETGAITLGNWGYPAA